MTEQPISGPEDALSRIATIARETEALSQLWVTDEKHRGSPEEESLVKLTRALTDILDEHGFLDRG